MILYSISAFFTSITSIALGVWVIYANSRDKKNILWLLNSIFIALWSFGLGFAYLSTNWSNAYFWIYFQNIAAIPISPLYYHFVVTLTQKNNSYIRTKYVHLIFLTLLTFAAILPKHFVQNVVPKVGFKYYVEPGIVYVLFAFFYTFFLLFSAYVLLNESRKQKSRRGQYITMFLVSAFGFGGGGTTFLGVFNIPFPPYGMFFVAFYTFIMAHGIVRHRLMDIEVIIRKTLVFTGLFFVLMAIVSIVTAIAQSYIGQHLNMGYMTSSIISVLIATVLYDPTRKCLVNITDKYLFQKKEDFKIVLNRLAKNIINILDLNAVAKTVLQTLQESLRVETGTLILKDSKTKNYNILNSFNLSVGRNFIADEFIQYFNDPDRIIDMEAVNAKDELPLTVIETLKAIKAVVCIPLFEQGELLGLLALGKKKSDQTFTQEEIAYLPVIASQTAIALKRAQLIEDLFDERRAKIEAEKKAERVNYTRTLKHEAGNKLVAIEDAAVNMKSHLTEKTTKLRQKLLERFVPKELRDLDQIEELVIKYADNFKMAGRRICMIIDSVVGALGGSKEAKQEMAFRVPWETAKLSTNVSQDFRFIVNVPDDYKIYGNVDLIERVFENFFTNSRDAMGDLKEKIVYLNGSYRTYEGNPVVWIEYWDEGLGVPEELFQKVFEQGFSTKAKPETEISMQSGHGYGLYVCKKIIEEFHNGRIWLEKREPNGSKFLFCLPSEPICKEE